MEQATLEHRFDEANKTLEVHLSGELQSDTLAMLSHRLTDTLTSTQSDHLILNAQNVSYCDGAGITFLLEAQQRFQTEGKSSTIIGLQKNFQKLYDQFKALPETQQLKSETPLSFIPRLGKGCVDTLKILKTNTTFLGEAIYYVVDLFKRPQSIRWKDAFYILEQMGPNAMPLAALIGFLFGVIMSFQAVVQLKMFGAEIYVADLVGISMVRELGPLMTAIILTGRTASSYAAELSTMKTNQEIDALLTMGFEPVRFLVVPRILAAAIMTPLLSLLLILFSFFGCMFIMRTQGFTPMVTLQEMQNVIQPVDIYGGLFKSVIFGIMIASIGCLHGLRSGTHSTAIGRSTTASVVSCIVMITVMDGLFTTVFYILGI